MKSLIYNYETPACYIETLGEVSMLCASSVEVQIEEESEDILWG